MRWEGNCSLLALQWKDNKIVIILFSIEVANEYVTVNCKMKIRDKWETVEVKQAMATHKYNAFMNGVDKSSNFECKCFTQMCAMVEDFVFTYDRYCPSQ